MEDKKYILKLEKERDILSMYLAAALAALSQKKTYPADVKVAKKWLQRAIQEMDIRNNKTLEDISQVILDVKSRLEEVRDEEQEKYDKLILKINRLEDVISQLEEIILQLKNLKIF